MSSGGATNPEQLFAIGYAACFETVLSLLAQRMNVTATIVLVVNGARLHEQRLRAAAS